MAGVLVLVVGPSGAGKDTLIAGARRELGADERFMFVRRLVTREAIAAIEDHDTISWEAFDAGRQEGAFAVSWEAHGLGYALPGSVLSALDANKVVIANVSRHVIAEVQERFPACIVISVTANDAVRAARLAERKREDAADVAGRLRRQVNEWPAGVRTVAIDNSGPLEQSTVTFVAALRAAAEK